MSDITAGYYAGREPIQGSFGISNHENMSISATDAASAPINSDIVLIVAMDYVKISFNSPATAASPILPPGSTMLTGITKGETLHFIRASTVDTELSIIIPK